MTIQTKDPLHMTERLNREGACALILSAEAGWFTMCGKSKKYPKSFMCEEHMSGAREAVSGCESD